MAEFRSPVMFAGAARLRQAHSRSLTYQGDHEFAPVETVHAAKILQISKSAACLRMNVSTLIGGVPVRSSTTVLVPAKTPFW
jgi:hypothetical protein